MAKRKVNEYRISGRQLVKPDIDPLALDVAMWIKSNGLSITQICTKTGLCRSTVKNIMDKKTRRPQVTTLRFILRCYGQEIVIRPIGSNQ